MLLIIISARVNVWPLFAHMCQGWFTGIGTVTERPQPRGITQKNMCAMGASLFLNNTTQCITVNEMNHNWPLVCDWAKALSCHLFIITLCHQYCSTDICNVIYIQTFRFFNLVNHKLIDGNFREGKNNEEIDALAWATMTFRSIEGHMEWNIP